MSQKTDLPTRPTFGDEFNYAVWTPQTEITLTSVPWNSDYRDIVKFASVAALNTYLDGRDHFKKTEMTYHKANQPIRLSIPFNNTYKYNYLRAYNPVQPINGDTARYFYYFITDIVYINPSTTELVLQLDLWQTFGQGVKFGNCYVERGHIGVANDQQNISFGRNYLTVPEGMDIGGEYEISGQWSQEIGSARGVENYSVVVVSTVALGDEPGTVDAPKLNTARGSAFENLPNGAEMYLFPSPGRFREFLSAYANKPWITQGIISVQAIPVYLRYDIPVIPVTIGGVSFFKVGEGTPKTKTVQVANNWRETARSRLEPRYRHLNKFLTFPYAFFEMTSYNGTPLVIKPESWSSASGEVVEVVHLSQPAPRIMFYPYRYNAANNIDGSPVVAPEFDGSGVVNDGGEFMDMSTGIYNMPTFSIPNNSYIGFMASSINSRSFQEQSADWSQQKALMGAETSFGQASQGMNLANDLSAQGINAARTQSQITNQATMLSGVQSGVNGALSNLGNRNPLGAVGAVANAAAGTAISINSNNQSMINSTGLAAGTNASQVNNMQYNRDTNWDYAQAAAQGDYSNAIAGINAKVQDAKLMQPSVSGQVGGDAFNLAQYKWGYDLKLKMIQGSARAMIGEFWLRYGYAVSRFIKMPDSLQVMSRFTFWKLKETYITAADCPEAYKQAIRGIFEKGVTVWKNPSDIGSVDIADNAPLTGVRY